MQSIKDLVARCLQKEVDKRPTATQLLEHKFFKAGTSSRAGSGAGRGRPGVWFDAGANAPARRGICAGACVYMR